eukprot:TRINITY_DN37904_c0_g1_i1.p1 TRINITY_DN37904_c0_g1~~TRINITY_DN37904_c0_g1_i1.p1  ORF type:complete len:117 (+),score=19.04 TRINITY_DN37904_c0_g1_i1:114-464(+)
MGGVVKGIPDINNDGIDEILIGADGNYVQGVFGLVYLIPGHNSFAQKRISPKIDFTGCAFRATMTCDGFGARDPTNDQSCDTTIMSFRSEERFSRNAETDLVCRLLLEKKNMQPSA